MGDIGDLDNGDGLLGRVHNDPSRGGFFAFGQGGDGHCGVGLCVTLDQR